MGGGDEVKETKDQRQEQLNNTKLWNYYQTTYKPFITKTAAQKTSNAASTVQSDKVAGQVNAEVMKSATAAPGQDMLSMTRKTNAAADVAADATTSATGQVRQRQLGDLQSLVDIGRGQQTQAQGLQESIADQSVRTAIADKQSELQTEAAMQNAAGSVAGAGAAMYYRSAMDPTARTAPPYQTANYMTGETPDNWFTGQ